MEEGEGLKISDNGLEKSGHGRESGKRTSKKSDKQN